MAFEKYSTAKLEKAKKYLIITSIVMLILMCVALGVALYQISHDIDSKLIFLIPTVFGPLTFFPIIVSSSVQSELKKRSQN